MPAFDGVALLVGLAAERRWAATCAAAALSVADLVGWFRDGRGDPASPQVGPVRAGAVGLVGQHWVRASPWPTRPVAGDSDAVEHGLELWTVTGLARGEHDRERFPALLAHARWILVDSPPRDRPKP
jgi:hypothetical protein